MDIKKLSYVAILLIFIATFNLPYGYYTFLRLFVFSTACYYFYDTRDKEKTNFIYIWFILCLLYNPIIPVNFKKDVWLIINIISIILIYSFILSYKSNFKVIIKRILCVSFILFAIFNLFMFVVGIHDGIEYRTHNINKINEYKKCLNNRKCIKTSEDSKLCNYCEIPYLLCEGYFKPFIYFYNIDHSCSKPNIKEIKDTINNKLTDIEIKDTDGKIYSFSVSKVPTTEKEIKKLLDTDWEDVKPITE